jgi:hypothetical protein
MPARKRLQIVRQEWSKVTIGNTETKTPTCECLLYVSMKQHFISLQESPNITTYNITFTIDGMAKSIFL